MDMDCTHDTTVSVVEGDPGPSTEATSSDNDRLEESSSGKEVVQAVWSALIRLELQLACCSEKLVNLNLLMMHVSAKECHLEAFISEKDDSLVISAEDALEFDILSGVFDSEVEEIDNIIGNLETQLMNAHDMISSNKHLGEVFTALEEKLRDAETSLKRSREQVSELRMQSIRFQRIIMSAYGGEAYDAYKDTAAVENGEFLNATAKLQMQTSEKQHLLRMLEKSLARELDLEDRLTECMQALERKKLKLHSSLQQVLSAEEETASIYAQFLEADSASAVLMGISKELIGQLQLCQLKINSALYRESELNTKLHNCVQSIQKLENEETVLKELAEKSNLEALELKEKVSSLEEQLKMSETALVNGNASPDCIDEQNEIKAMEEKVIMAESRAEKSEDECKLLMATNKELSEELELLKGSGVSQEKINSLEKQLSETYLQLQQAQASIEASEEREKMLCTSIEDMEILIEKLTSNVASAETQAEKAKAECSLLEDANIKLTKELDLLKGSGVSHEKINSLEKQLSETDLQLQQALASIEASKEREKMLYTSIEDMEVLIEKLRSNVASAETRAEKAKAECSLLEDANIELTKELDLLKANNILNEKVATLEKQLKETDIQLQQATVSVEASQEKQRILCSSIHDMEILIESLKSRVLKADARADSAEDKCITLSESHAELSEELNFLRGKVESLEASLQQAGEAKLTAAKDINIRTKVVTDLVMQLALERERLQKQIASLAEDKRALEDRLQMENMTSSESTNHQIGETKSRVFASERSDRNISGTTEADKSAEDVRESESTSDSEELESEVETVRTIDATRLSFKHIFSASLIALIAVMAACSLSPENCPF